MKLQMTNEAVFTVPMIASAAWTAITGDTFLPSLAGACFAVYFRTQRDSGGVEGRNYACKDLVATGVMSLVIGLIAGPYVADRLPDGEGVVGVGALIASFVGVGAATKMNRMDWDVGVIFKHLADALARKK